VFRNLISLSFGDNSETAAQKDCIDLEITLKMRDMVVGGRRGILACGRWRLPNTRPSGGQYHMCVSTGKNSRNLLSGIVLYSHLH